jgi:hypothetical protein
MLVTKAEYARRHGVSKPAVGKWEARGWLVMHEGKVDVEKSDANLSKYRDPADGRAKRGDSKPEPVNSAKVNRRAPAAKAPSSPAEPSDEEQEKLEEARRIIASLGADLSTEEARRVKENYLALLHRLEYLQKEGELIELQLARSVLFDEARAARDAWLNWPARFAALIAAELGVDADRATEVLTGYVHKQIKALGEPAGLFEQG